MQISVIVPCYNEESYLARCLKTLFDQSLGADEVIVVDDGSTDRSREIALQFPVKLLKGRHEGPGNARNLGAHSSQGDILVFVDADMYVDREFLEHLTRPIRDGNSIGCFHLDEFVGNYDNVIARCWNVHSGFKDDRRIPLDYPESCPIYRAIRRDAFMRIGGYSDCGYGEDESIGRKLGVMATGVRGAISYHNNPATLTEVFESARWIGKGMPPQPLGYYLRLIPVYTVLKALRRAFRMRTPVYALFSPVYDFGILCGLIMRRLTGRHTK
ncbi:MAG: glycosyltransferase family 2 protein [Sulfobacillus sp.]